MISFTFPSVLFLLLLGTNCFTLPLSDEQISTTTISSLNDSLTTTNEHVLRSIDIDQTTPSSSETMELEISTPTLDNIEATSTRNLRSMHMDTTSEPFSATISDIVTEANTVSSENSGVDATDNNQFETTNSMSTLTSTHVEDINLLETSSPTSTDQYVGLLRKHKDSHHDEEIDEEQEEEREERPKQEIKQRTHNRKDRKRPHNEKQNAPEAQLEQDGIENTATVQNTFMIFDEDESFVVTTTKNKDENNTLSQGSTLTLFLLAALLFCTCLTASALAFARSRHTVKRKSRITEMEAHLDDDFHHPLIFQQHHDK